MLHSRKNIIKAAALAVLAVAGLASAQVEVLTAPQQAAYSQRLPNAIEAASSPDFRLYLQEMQKNPSGHAVRDLANGVRVAEDLKAAGNNAGGIDAGAFVVHYAVPAVSPVMRLPDAYPADGVFAGEVGIVAAQDEYEPASFVLHALRHIDKADLKVSDLKSEAGDVFSRDNLDLKVVKVWYQNGNGWFSYFNDVGLVLVPELLLNDENLVRVDTERVANYAHVKGPAGDRQVWITAPRKIDVGFDAYQPGFADAATLQPVSLATGKFKQFFLTAHVAPGTKPGIYRGSIEVTAAGQKPATIPVSLRVLPFALPKPKAGYDLNKDFVVTLMTAWPKLDPRHKAFMPTLRNLRRHNLLHLGPGISLTTPPEIAELQVKAMKEAGFETNFIIGGTMPGWVGTHDGTPLTYDELKTVERAAKAWRDLAMKYFGHTNIAISHGDEQAAPWVMKTRPLWRILHENGLKTNLAGHEHIFAKAGYMMDVHPAAGTPADPSKAKPWRDVGHGHVGFYASQHNGSENPSFVRRQHGLLGYLSDYDMVNNYEFAYGPWNDLSVELYKPMVLAYPTSEGLVDTLAWEGFREGIDDIRYATKLKQLAAEAIESGDLDRIYAGRQVRQWFTLMDGTQVDLNSVRLEMIEKIERLMAMSGSKQVSAVKQ